MVPAALLGSRWCNPVFSAHSRDYDWFDVFLAAMLRHDWGVFEQRLTKGLALAADAESTGRWPDAAQLDAAATAFRYLHDLLSAEETDVWLAASGLTIDAWSDFLARGLLNDADSAGVAALIERHASALVVTDELLAAEGFCSGTFARWRDTLAGRVAVVAGASAAATGIDTDTPPTSTSPIPPTLLRDSAHWFAALDTADRTTRLTHLAQLETSFQREAALALTERSLEQQLARNRMDWTRVDLDRLSFARLDAASEALLCLREDGLTLEDVALDAHQSIHETRDLLIRLPAGWRDVVLSAGVDDVLGPIEVGDRVEIGVLLGKMPARLDDDLVRRRAETAVVEQLVANAVLTHVRPASRL